MAGEAALGRAVLELSTDDQKLNAGLADTEKSVQKLGADLKAFGASISKALETSSATALAERVRLLDQELLKLNTTGKATAGQLSTIGKEAAKLKDQGATLGSNLSDVAGKFGKASEGSKGFGAALGQVNGLLGAFGVSLSVGAVVEFGKSLLELGDNTMKVHDRTGLAIEDVQRLSYIAGQSGNTIDDLAGSMSKLQIRLADGKAKEGIEALGLNFAKIRNESPYDALGDVAEAIGKIENPTLRAERAVQVFGKAGTEILPTLVSNFKELGQQAPVASDETIQALDAAGDALARFGASIKVWAAESYNWARGFFDKLVAGVYSMIAKLYENAASLAELASRLPGASKLGIDPAFIAGLKESAVWYGNVSKAMETTTTKAVEQRKTLGALPPIVSDEDKKALKEQAAALEEIRRAAIPLTDAQKAAAVANQALGISAGTTAKAFKISEAAVSSYLEGLKTAAEVEKAWAETRQKWADETRKIINKATEDFRADQQKMADASAKAITERLKQTIDFEQRNADAERRGADLAIVQIERERDAAIAALNAQSELRGPLYDRDLAAITKFYQRQIDLAKGTASTIEQRMRAQGVATREDLALQADAATRDYEQMRASGLYSAGEIQAAFVRMQDAIAKSRGAVVDWGQELANLANILGAFGKGGVLGAAVAGIGAIGKAMDVAAASTKQWGNSAGVAAPIFSANATTAQKAAAGVASGATAAAGALDVWAATSEKAGKAAGTLNGAVAGAKAGAAFGPYGVAIGAAAGAVVGLVRALNDGRQAVQEFAKTFDTAAAGSGFDELHAKLLKVAGGEQLWIDLTQKVGRGDVTAAKKAIDAINAALGDQDAWLGRLPGVLEKYGIAWEQAGAAVNQARLDEVAKGLIQDFADLSRAGVDVDTITQKMADSVNAYIADAKRTGTEVPPALRPLIQKMIDLGVATDENGDKITDLEGSGITFAQTMTEGFQSVVSAIKELTKALGGVPSALDKIPNQKTIDLEFRGRRTGYAPGDDEGGDPTDNAIPMAGGGFGRVTRPTLFYSRGDEDFAFSGEGRSFGMGALASRPIELTNITQLDGREVARNQIRHTPNELARVGVRSR